MYSINYVKMYSIKPTVTHVMFYESTKRPPHKLDWLDLTQIVESFMNKVNMVVYLTVCLLVCFLIFFTAVSRLASLNIVDMKRLYPIKTFNQKNIKNNKDINLIMWPRLLVENIKHERSKAHFTSKTIVHFSRKLLFYSI